MNRDGPFRWPDTTRVGGRWPGNEDCPLVNPERLAAANRALQRAMHHIWKPEIRILIPAKVDGDARRRRKRVA